MLHMLSPHKAVFTLLEQQVVWSLQQRQSWQGIVENLLKQTEGKRIGWLNYAQPTTAQLPESNMLLFPDRNIRQCTPLLLGTQDSSSSRFAVHRLLRTADMWKCTKAKQGDKRSSNCIRKFTAPAVVLNAFRCAFQSQYPSAAGDEVARVVISVEANEVGFQHTAQHLLPEGQGAVDFTARKRCVQEPAHLGTHSMHKQQRQVLLQNNFRCNNS
jgi:hypothetical protein